MGCVIDCSLALAPLKSAAHSRWATLGWHEDPHCSVLLKGDGGCKHAGICSALTTFEIVPCPLFLEVVLLSCVYVPDRSSLLASVACVWMLLYYKGQQLE